MSRRLEGRTVFITGAAQGQGAAHARYLAAEGARLVLGDIDQEGLAAVVESLEADGAEALGARLDVASADDWARFVAAGVERFGAAHGLVNNAGISSTPGVEAWDPAAWDRVVAINQTGTVLGMQAVAPTLRAAGGGSIVNVSSVWAHTGGEAGRSIGYVATKAAVLGMTKAAALEFAADGTRVNSISPGYIDHLMRGSLGNPAADGIPLGRLADVGEMSGTVAFLLSDDASYITGVDILVDGGMHLG
jgi:3alpha(or 20beta)-hydroxysteroid dehydrogenase